MKHGWLIVSLALVVAGCQKAPEAKCPPASQADASASAPAAPPPEAAPVDPKLAEKKAALDYATMESTYLNDPKGQWASAATASSTFGETGSNGASDVNKPKNLVGKPDEREWTNDHQDMGFDNIETTFEKPVHATEVRAVFRDGVAAVSKLELKGADGAYTTIWSGVNEDPEERRGPRHWFVRKFDRTANPVVGVKITLANTVDHGYKVVDAVQLVGE
ncbi:MAG: hypothetical protein QM747_13465 [Nocardioides sp.]